MKHSLGENDWKLNKLMFELRYVVHEGSAERGARKSIMRKCNKFKMQVDTQGIQVTKIDLTYWGGGEEKYRKTLKSRSDEKVVAVIRMELEG